jgi:hypothetical protein
MPEIPDWMQEQPDDGNWGAEEELPGYLFYNDTIKLHFDPGPHVYFRYDEDGVRRNIDGVTTVLNVISKPFLVPWATKLCIETLQKYLISSDGGINPFTTEELLMWMAEAKNKHKEHLEKAGDIGHIAHEILEKSIQFAIDNNKGVVLELKGLPEPDFYTNELTPENQKATNCANAGFQWMKNHNVRWLSTERKVYSKLYNFAGTADGKCIVDSCTDLKCCRGRVFHDHVSVADWKSSNQLSDSYAYQTAAYQFAEIEEMGEHIGDRFVLRLGKEDGEFEPWYLPADYFEDDLNAFLAALELYRSLAGITQRRKADAAELRAIIKKIRDEAKAIREAQERQERLEAREASKKATKERQEAKDKLYKSLRADGMATAEAKSEVAKLFPTKPKAESLIATEVIQPEPEEPFDPYSWVQKL